MSEAEQGRMDLLESEKTAAEPTYLPPIKHRPFIRPFVTSTPLDFERERDFLASEIYPELDELCQLRACHFLPTDLRYEENDLNAQNGSLLKLHLDMIARASPFFMCLMGERYGDHRPQDSPLLKAMTSPDDPGLSWIDKNLLIASSGAYKWILEDVQQYSSLTELEIIQACFFSENDYSFLYFRQQDHVDSLFLDLSPSERESKLEIYYSESEYAGMKARDLKQRVVNRGLSVKYFNSLEQLGSMVMRDWIAVIDLLYPPLVDVGHHITSEFYRESILSETVASYRKDFVSSYDLENAMADLTHFTSTAVCDVTESMDQSHAVGLSFTTRMRRKSRRVVAGYTSILALTGQRGCGKTSLITRWMEQAHLENEDVTIVSHHVGGSRLSQDIAAVMRKALQRLWLQHQVKLSSGDLSCLNLSDNDYQGLCETFVAAASLGPTVFVIDGVDQLTCSDQFSLAEIKRLEWLPNKIPSNVKFILSTSSSDATFVTLSQRSDVRLLECPEFNDVTLRGRILTDNLADYKTVVNAGVRLQIVEAKLAANPLFLKMVAMEMSSRSVYACAESMAETFSELATVREFWTLILRRWVMEMSWSTDGVRAEEIIAAQGEFEFLGWVADALRLVAVSRQGLVANDIFVCLQRLGYHGNSAVSMTDLALLWEAGHKAFSMKLGPLIWFQHNQLREVVDYALLGTVVGDNSEESSSSWNKQKQKYHEHLLEYFYNQPFSWERSEELVYQCEMTGDMDVLYDELTDHRILLLMTGVEDHPARLIHLHRLWNRLTSAGHDVINAYRDVIKCCADGVSVTKKSKRIPDAILNDASTFMTELNQQQPGTFEPLDASALSRLMYHVALFLWKRDHVIEAREVLKEANDLLSKNYPLPVGAQYGHCLVQETLGRLYSNDVITMTTDVPMETMRSECFSWNQRTLSGVDSLLEMAGGNNKLYLELKGRVLDKIGSLYIQSADVSLAAQVLHQSESCFDLSGCSIQKSSVLFQLARMSALVMNFKETLYFFQRCLKLRERWMGKHHPTVADVLLQMAKLTANKDNVDGYDRERAELLYRQAVQIREESLSPTHPYTAEAVLGLGCLLKENGSLSSKLEARTLLQRALDIHITKSGYDHPDCAGISRSLSDLNVALKLGLYDYGPAKPTDKRHTEFPYSDLSWRENQLNNLDKKFRQRASSAKYHKLESKLRKETEIVKPEIKIDDVSVKTDDVILTGRRSRQIKSASVAERLARQKERDEMFKRVSVDVKMVYPSQDIVVDSAFMSIPKSPAPSSQDIIHLDGDFYERRSSLDGKRSPADVTPREDDVIEGAVVTSPVYLDSYALPHRRETYEQQFSRIRPRPTSAPVQLEKRFTLLRMREPSPPRPVSRMSVSSRTPRVQSATSYATHQTTCRLPGTHSVTTGNAISVTGPHSDIQSLLGHRRSQSGVGIHHKSAWYHVPGRYPTPGAPVPAGRRQLSKRAKSLSSTTCRQTARRSASESATFQPSRSIIKG